MNNSRKDNEIERLLEDVSTPESSQNEEDPFQDYGEYDSDENYEPDFESQSSSSDEEIYIGRPRVSRPTMRSSSSSFSNSNEVGDIIPSNSNNTEFSQPTQDIERPGSVVMQSTPGAISDEIAEESTEIQCQIDTIWSRVLLIGI